jgi:pimeloyl-ACP methyl ester carboxylesterase
MRPRAGTPGFGTLSLKGVARETILGTLAGILACSLGCFGLRPAPAPIPTLEHVKGTSDRLVVLLPGRGGHAEDFQKGGFLDVARQAGLRADVVAVDAHLAYYANRTIVDRLREDVIAPARAKGYKEVWLVGISMGGLGALLYAERHPEDVAGICLIAPFLGNKATPKEIQDAGGLKAWSPGEPLDPKDYQRSLWMWLKNNCGDAAGQQPIPVYLGYGSDDAFVGANALLGAALPPDRIFKEKGGHDWPVWKKLWTDFLQRASLGEDSGTGPRALP